MLTAGSASGQLINQADFYAVPLLMNPAFAGSNKAPRVTHSRLYRELTNIDRMFGNTDKFEFISYYVSLDYGYKSSGFALQYSYDMPYYENYRGYFLATYSHDLKVNEDLTLTPALSLGFFHFQEKNTIISLDSSFNYTPSDPDGFSGKMMNTGISLLARRGNLIAGLNIEQLNSPVFREDYHVKRKHPTLLLHASYNLKIGRILQLIPAAFYYSNADYGGRIHILEPRLRVNLKYFEIGTTLRVNNKLNIPLTTYSAGVHYKWAKLNYTLIRFNDEPPSFYHQITLTASLKELK